MWTFSGGIWAACRTIASYEGWPRALLRTGRALIAEALPLLLLVSVAFGAALLGSLASSVVSATAAAIGAAVTSLQVEPWRQQHRGRARLTGRVEDWLNELTPGRRIDVMLADANLTRAMAALRRAGLGCHAFTSVPQPPASRPELTRRAFAFEPRARPWSTDDEMVATIKAALRAAGIPGRVLNDDIAP